MVGAEEVGGSENTTGRIVSAEPANEFVTSDLLRGFEQFLIRPAVECRQVLIPSYLGGVVQQRQ